MRYMSVSDALIGKAQERMDMAARHKARGDQHLKDGHPEYAAGSFRKAEKNMALATKELESAALFSGRRFKLNG